MASTTPCAGFDPTTCAGKRKADLLVSEKRLGDLFQARPAVAEACFNVFDTLYACSSVRLPLALSLPLQKQSRQLLIACLC